MVEQHLFRRIFFSIKQAWHYRRRLHAYLEDPKLQIKNVAMLDSARLQNEGVHVLVLDFDGVLGSDHALQPRADLLPWLDTMYAYFQDRLFILSNKPLAAREQHLKLKYPKLQFVKNVAKKPYPEGLLKIKALTKVSGECMLFCDDRLLTGILAAQLAEVRSLWVTEPCRDFAGRLWHELFFAALRFIDRCFLRVCG